MIRRPAIGALRSVKAVDSDLLQLDRATGFGYGATRPIASQNHWLEVVPARHEGNALASQLDEVPDRQVPDLLVVDQHGAYVVGRRGVVEHDNGTAVSAQPFDDRVGVLHRGQEQAGDRRHRGSPAAPPAVRRSLSELASWSMRPLAFAARCAPSAMSTNSELRSVGTTRPTVRVLPEARALAMLLREKPSSAIAARTFSRVPSDTRSGWFRTWDTVPTETPALAATSGSVGREEPLLPFPRGGHGRTLLTRPRSGSQKS